MSEEGHTQRLADWASKLRYSELPPAVIHHTKRSILDFTAAALAGSEAPPAIIVRSYLAGLRTTGRSSVFGTDLRFTAPDAALVNGTSGHSLELDDGYTPGAFHPGACVLPAVLAQAEAMSSSPEDIIVAAAAGFEVSCRIAAAGHPATWRRGFHNTPVAGVFGAAIGTALLLSKDPVVLAGALGLAGSHASGLFEFSTDGSDVKRLHAGKAARDGVVSAGLSLAGLGGPATILEGKAGYFAAYADGAMDEDVLIGQLGTSWKMLDTYLKLYPCCRHVHGAIDGVIELNRDNPIDPATLTSITVDTYAVAARHNSTVVNGMLDAQLSLPFAVATTLVHGTPVLEHFRPEVWNDPQIQRLMQMVVVRDSPDCSRDYPAMRPSRVVLETSSERREIRIDQPLGEPANPVSDEDLELKVQRILAPRYGSARTNEVIAAAWSLASADDLFRVLGAPGQHVHS